MDGSLPHRKLREVRQIAGQRDTKMTKIGSWQGSNQRYGKGEGRKLCQVISYEDGRHSLAHLFITSYLGVGCPVAGPVGPVLLLLLLSVFLLVVTLMRLLSEIISYIS